MQSVVGEILEQTEQLASDIYITEKNTHKQLKMLSLIMMLK